MSRGREWLLPREHGAWGMLLQPFAAAAILAGQWTPALGAALAAALAVFLMREPMLVLARQRWVWRERHPESARAWWWLVCEAAVAAAAGLYLWFALPRLPLIALGAVAAAMTLAAIFLTLRNRQRSPAFQVAVAAGLGSSCLLAALAATGRLPSWAWLLWVLLTLHSVTAIFVVHARLARRTKQARAAFVRAVRVDAAQLVLGAAAALAAGLYLAAPMLFSAALNALELRRLSVFEPLTRVGLRTLAVSLAHTALSAAVLWNK